MSKNLKTDKVSQDDFYEIEQVSSEYRWLDDEDYQKGLLELWGLFDNQQQKDLIIELIGRVQHFGERDRVKNIRLLIDYLVVNSINPKNTIIVATADGSSSDGSNAFQYFFKSELAKLDGWSETNLKPSIDASFKKFDKYKTKNIVIFDDFIGTGVTMIEKVTTYRQRLKSQTNKDVNIILFAYAGMSFGIKNAEDKLGLKIHCPIQIKKGISDYESKATVNEKIKTMLTLENKLSSKFNNTRMESYSLGHGKSEGLYNTYSLNCPDNVFPIFWWPSLKKKKRRNTIFNRLPK